MLALALQDLSLLAADQAPGLLLHVWRLDDGLLIGQVKDLRSVMHMLKAGGPEIGPQLGVCAARWPAPSSIHQQLPEAASADTATGITCLEAPLGHVTCCQELAEKKIRDIE